MGGGDIGARKLCIELDHVEAPVAEGLLERELAAAIAQELDRKGVSERVRADADAADPCGTTGPSHQLAEAVRRKRGARGQEEERFLVVPRLAAAAHDVAPELIGAGGSVWGQPLMSALAVHEQVALADVAHRQPTELGRP